MPTPKFTIQKQALSIPLTGGIDRKTDKHQLASGNMYTADNVQYISQKQISKRYGYVAINSPGGLQGAPFTAIGMRDSVEPVFQGGNTLNRYNLATGLSTYVAAPTQGRVDSLAITASSGAYKLPVVPSNPSCATDKQKYICVVWEEPQTTTNVAFFYGIQDISTGNWIISPRTQGPIIAGSPVCAPKVVFTGSAFALFWVEYSGTYPVINTSLITLTNLNAGAVNQSAAALTTGGSGSISATSWGYDVVGQVTNKAFTNAVIVGWSLPMSTSNTSLTTQVFAAAYNNGNTTIAPSSKSAAVGSMAGINGAFRAAVTYNTNAVFVATQGTVSGFTGTSLAGAGTAATTPVSIVNAAGTYKFNQCTGCPISIFATATQLYHLQTVQALDSTSTYATNHNIISIMPLSVGLPSVPTSTLVADPPNNTILTSYLSKPFYGITSTNLYVWIGGGGYQNAIVNSNAYLVEIPLAATNTWGNSVARCLYGVAANIGQLNRVTPPCDVLPTLSTSRFITYISTATFDAAFTAQGVPTSFYGALNLTGFDFSPARSNQLLEIPQGGIFATSALPWQYDGQQVVEAGFSVAPALTVSAGANNGSLAAATYWYTMCFIRRDAYGNVMRSAPATAQQVTTGASGTVLFPPLLTYAGGNVYVEYYRSVSTSNTSAAAPGVYYMIASLPQDTLFTDTGTYTDTTIQYQPTVYTASGEIENDPPPPVHSMAFGENRAYIIPSDARNQLWYSKPYYPGKQLEWSANFTVNEGANAALFTAVAVLDSNVIVFKADSIAYFTGDGPDATGSNGSFSNFQRLASDVGCTDPGSLAIIPGGLLFRSRRGIELLSRGLQVQYVGAPVEPLVQAITTIASTVVLPNYQQVRFVPSLAGQPVLVFDYAYNRWSTYSGMASVQAAVLNGQYWWLSADGTQVFQETPGQFSDNGKAIYLTLETPEMSMAGIQGWARAYRMAILADFKSSHSLIIQFAYDHKPDYVDTVTYNVAATVDYTAAQTNYGNTDTLVANQAQTNITIIAPGEPEQVRLSRMPRQRMQTVRMLITDTALIVSDPLQSAKGTYTLPFGESCAISAITVEYGQKAALAKLGPAGTV